MKIGLYGGSFDPVHLGHVGIARRAIDDLSLDRLIVLPANVSPFKSEHPAVWDRIALVQAAFRELEKTVVDLREVSRGGVSYTIDTVREIAAENPGAELYFIIGEDSVEGLPRWKEIDALRKLCTFKAYPRTPESSTAIRKLFEDNGVTLNPDEKVVQVVRQGLVRKGGYCPCRLPKSPEFFCPCDEFKGQLGDPSYHGLCHCRLYLKP
ncbi:MAG: nicotinate (nicotinamide) nucleotide adenylyltransferase [Kiritimatiellia bacterium]